MCNVCDRTFDSLPKLKTHASIKNHSLISKETNSTQKQATQNDIMRKRKSSNESSTPIKTSKKTETDDKTSRIAAEEEKSDSSDLTLNLQYYKDITYYIFRPSPTKVKKEVTDEILKLKTES